jgi:sugar lactone lactonase YvrE
MRRPIHASLSLLCSASVFAHPGVGIVEDSRGAIYYTDLKQVWRVAPDGSKTVAVPGVHTHELWMDAQDNLYGEHLWYDGEEKDTWGHRVWRRRADGRIEDYIAARTGFRDDHDDFHFVRDASGTMYWVDRGVKGAPSAVRKRAPGGPAVTIARARFENVRWMTVMSDGVVYLMNLFDLVRIDPGGTVRTVAKRIVENRRSFLGSIDQHAVMGLWTDRPGNVYAAVYADGLVKRFTPDARASVVARSPRPWGPTGGLVASDGALWLLEGSPTNQARARRVAPRVSPGGR